MLTAWLGVATEHPHRSSNSCFLFLGPHSCQSGIRSPYVCTGQPDDVFKQETREIAWRYPWFLATVGGAAWFNLILQGEIFLPPCDTKACTIQYWIRFSE